MTFDVSQFELADTAILRVRNLRGDGYLMVDGKPVTIELYGPGSPEGVRVSHRTGKVSAARLNEVMRGTLSEDAPEQADRDKVEELVALTKAINNFPVDSRELYSNPRLIYIRTQVESFLGKPGNFEKPPITPSASTSSKPPG